MSMVAVLFQTVLEMSFWNLAAVGAHKNDYLDGKSVSVAY